MQEEGKDTIPWWGTPIKEAQKPQAPQVLTDEERQKLKDVESIKKEIETWEAGEQIVWGRAMIIGRGLERIKNGLVKWTSVDDPEYRKLLETYNRLVNEYEAIQKGNQRTVHILDSYISELKGEAKTYIEKKTPSERPTETQKPSIELTQEEKDKIDAEMKVEAWKIAKSYWFNETNFYLRVKAITYNPKIPDKDVGEGMFNKKEDTIEAMKGIAESLKSNPSMKDPVVNEKELTDLDDKRKQLDWLPEAKEITELKTEISRIWRAMEILWKDVPSEESKKKLEDLSKDLETKKKELEKLKSEPYKKLEKEIDDLDKKGKEQLWRIIRANPAWFSHRIQESISWPKKNILTQLINLFTRKLFGFDLFPENSWSGWSGNSRFDSGWLISWDAATELGALSEQFESGGRWPEAITANDANLWFPSFGTYQMNREILKEFAAKMWIAGNHLETSDSGEFAQNWKKKIQDIWVKKFKEEERAFIKTKFFEPQLAKIKWTWVDTSKFSLAMQNVIWSTAVQHGQGTDIVSWVVSKYAWQSWNIETEKKVIEEIYTERQKKPWSNANRYSQEKAIVLAQLSMYNTSPDGSARSLPMEFSSSGTTLCSQTARLNGARFWVQLPSWDAKAVEESYGSKLNRSWNPPASGNCADVFSGSTRYPQYGHRAFAYKNAQWNWYVLDPYLRIQSDRQAPIPWGTYMSFLRNSWRWFNGAVWVG